jgi:alkylation response protein AidB-like acyl-CoA dehydrogenase
MSDLGHLMGDSVASLLEKFNAGHKRSRGSGEEWSSSLWQQVADIGLPLALVSEENDGVGCDAEDVFEILRASCHYAPPIPLAEPMLAGWLTQSPVPHETDHMATIAEVGLDSHPVVDLAADSVRFSGELNRVPWGRRAGTVVCCVEKGDREIIIALPTLTARITEGYNIAGEPVDQLLFDRVEIPLSQCRIECGRQWRQALRRFGALCRCAQMVGAMEAALSLTLNYAGERHQFGRPIKKFQVIQHYLAVMSAEVAAAKMTTQVAFSAERPWENVFRVAAAKSRVSEAVSQFTSIAHQVHGAMGFAAEYGLHLFTKRLWAWRDEYGSEMEWNERLGRMIAEREQPDLWAMLTSIDR